MINDNIFFFFYNLSHKSVFFDWIAVFIAHILPYLVIFFVIMFLLFHHEVFFAEKPFKELAQKWKEIVLVFFSGCFAWCIATLLKIIMIVPRPYLQFPEIQPLISKTDFSFPSGHATFYMALAFSIFFSHKKAGYIFIFFALLIGIARIIVGVHFPVDILAGYLIGIATAYFVKFFYEKINKKI